MCLVASDVGQQALELQLLCKTHHVPHFTSHDSYPAVVTLAIYLVSWTQQAHSYLRVFALTVPSA